MIAPALRLVRERLRRATDVPFAQRAAARAMLAQVDLLWRRRMLEYLLVRAVRG